MSEFNICFHNILLSMEVIFVKLRFLYKRTVISQIWIFEKLIPALKTLLQSSMAHSSTVSCMEKQNYVNVQL
jgi:hypothetical protein